MSGRENRLDRKGWNWAPVPAKVIMSEKLTHADVRVYAYLLWRAGKDDHSWPAVETIGRDIHMSEPSVKRSFKSLIKDNWIRRSRRVGHSSFTFVFETQEECIAFDPANISQEIQRRIMGDTTNVSQVIRINKSQVKENQKNESQEKEGAGAPADDSSEQKLTEGLRFFKSAFGLKKQLTPEGFKAISALERTYGTDLLKEVISWAAKKQMRAGDAIGAIESAIAAWGQPKKNGKGPASHQATDAHDIIQRRREKLADGNGS